ncbi:hypothetical protein [Halpernia sp. GG3]
MARYTRTKNKNCTKIWRCNISETIRASKRETTPPGTTLDRTRRRGTKKSEYAIQLMEKQKAKYTYGILERQFSESCLKKHQS